MSEQECLRVAINALQHVGGRVPLEHELIVYLQASALLLDWLDECN